MKDFSELSNSKDMRTETLENQAKFVYDELSNIYKVGMYAKPAYVFEEMIVFSEVSKELTQIGFDVIIHRGSNIKDSWTEISWENAKEGRNGEIKEIWRTAILKNLTEKWVKAFHSFFIFKLYLLKYKISVILANIPKSHIM